MSNRDDYIQSHIERGFVIHPLRGPEEDCKSPGKQPIVSQWEQLTLPQRKEDIDRWFKDTNRNIGLVCGKASGVTVIDMDSEVFFPGLCQGIEFETLVSRRTAGRGHYFFKYDPEFTIQHHTDLGIEVLTDGGNIVLPGSTHTSGDVYQWVNPDAEIIEMPEELKRRLLKLFELKVRVNSLVTDCRPCFRELWSKREKKDRVDLHGGDGREMMLAFATELSANNATDEDLIFVAKVLYQGDFDKNRTLQELKHVDKTKPWKCKTIHDKLSGYVNCSKCDISDRAPVDEPIKTYSLEEIQATGQKLQDRSLNVKFPKGHLITDMVNWMSSLTDAYQEYTVSGCLWAISSLVERKVCLNLKQEKIFPNLWINNIGRSTTSRKSTVSGKIRQIYESAAEIKIYNDEYSIEGYIETLCMKPILPMIRDEAGGQFAKQHKRYNDGYFDFECQIYDGQSTQKSLSGGKSSTPKVYTVNDPYVTKLYSTTPSSFLKYMTMEDFENGYGYRFLYTVPNYDRPTMPFGLETIEDINAFGAIVSKLKWIKYEMDKIGEPVKFTVDKDAMELYNENATRMQKEIEQDNNSQLESAFGRSLVHIWKIAMLIEIGREKISFNITKESIQIASDMVFSFYLPGLLDLVEQLHDDIKHNQVEIVEKKLRMLGGTAQHTKLLQQTHLKSKEFNECIETLFESDTIELMTHEGTNKRYYVLKTNKNNKTNTTNGLTESTNSDVSFVSSEAVDIPVGCATSTHSLCYSVSPVSSVSSVSSEVEYIEVMPLKNIPEFTGIDGVKYNLEEGQPVLIPSIHAKGLHKKHAVNIVSPESVSQRDRAKIIVDAIRDLQSGVGASFADVALRAADHGISADQLNRTLTLTKQQGRIFEPNPGFLKVV